MLIHPAGDEGEIVRQLHPGELFIAQPLILLSPVPASTIEARSVELFLLLFLRHLVAPSSDLQLPPPHRPLLLRESADQLLRHPLHVFLPLLPSPLTKLSHLLLLVPCPCCFFLPRLVVFLQLVISLASLDHISQGPAKVERRP